MLVIFRPRRNLILIFVCAHNPFAVILAPVPILQLLRGARFPEVGEFQWS